jgi:hypothetical protein
MRATVNQDGRWKLQPAEIVEDAGQERRRVAGLVALDVERQVVGLEAGVEDADHSVRIAVPAVGLGDVRADKLVGCGLQQRGAILVERHAGAGRTAIVGRALLYPVHGDRMLTNLHARHLLRDGRGITQAP